MTDFRQRPPFGTESDAGPGTDVPLSVIVAAKDAWPGLRACLDVLATDVAGVGGELIVACADAAARPPDAEVRYPGAVWLLERDASLFCLRALAVRRTRGEVVALTEDHARVAPGWSRAVLAAHAAHPEAAAIGGVVENGADRSLVDWASFFIANGPFLAPVAAGASRSISLQANVSYKRGVLAGCGSPLGWMQMTFHRDLLASGETLVAEPRLVVVHSQEMHFAGHAAGHFHNGRAIAAFRRERMSRAERALRTLGCFALPPVMLWRTVRAVLAKRRLRGHLALSLPAIAALLSCHAAGELAGYVAGAGTSPGRVK